MQAQITFAGNRHAQRAVCEHLYFHQPTRRPRDLPSAYFIHCTCHLPQAELTRQHHRIGESGVKFHRVDIADICLG